MAEGHTRPGGSLSLNANGDSFQRATCGVGSISPKECGSCAASVVQGRYPIQRLSLIVQRTISRK